ncbi:MAG TPA: hypothetical protein PLZ75_12900, partial [Bacteroidales bacterium]|nr:hypothetical protein [Bacteroidales bacterium]
FNSVITIYIIIPLLIIPMMVLSGAMFPFDKLNRKIGNVGKVPFLAELMPTRWTYEALMLTQFRNNRYSTTEYNREGETYYSLQKKISESDFNRVYRIPELKRRLSDIPRENVPASTAGKTPARPEKWSSDLILLKNEMIKISDVYKVPQFGHIASLSPEAFSSGIADSLNSYLSRLDEIFSMRFNSASETRDRFYNLNSAKLNELQDQHYNYQLEQIVTKYFERHKMLIYNNSIIQNVDPVYLDPVKKGVLSFRTHFFAPTKYFLGKNIDTYRFNIRVVLINSLFLYLILYFNLLARAIGSLEKFKTRKRLISK